MAPNLFLCIRTIFCPTYWFQRGERIKGSLHHREEHWDSPLPGTYRYSPGHGWRLIRRDGSDMDEKIPVSLVYCRILHRYLFDYEMEERCQWHSVPTVREKELGGDYNNVKSGSSSRKTERFLFFRLDDGWTWVAGWDAAGKFIPGPYQKWYYDEETETMKRMTSAASSAVVSRSSSVFGKM